MSFLAELRRRNVIRMAGLYLVGAWLVVQVAATVLPLFDAPGWMARSVVVLLAIGFVPSLVIAWVFEWTPDGLRRDTEVDPAASIAPQTGKRMDRMIVAGLVAVIALMAVERFWFAQEPTTAAPATAAATAAPAQTAAAINPKSIAVLAFENMSADKDNEYFSDGVAEEILNSLAKVKSLKVAGRTSSFSFKGKHEDLRAIGKTLGVAHILDGSVRKQGDKVRVTAQLIRSDDGIHLWSEVYDGNLDDVFALQEKIARAITTELDIVLNGTQATRLVDAGTTNAEAYALYLQASATFNRRDSARFGEAIAQLEQATALDPGFARAYSRLAALYGVALNADTVAFDDAVANAERFAHRASQIDPTLAEPHAVLGLNFRYQRKPREAAAAFARALALEPDDVTANFWWAITLTQSGYRRQGIVALDRTLQLDPLLPNALFWRAREHIADGEVDQGERLLRRAEEGGHSFVGLAEWPLERSRGNRDVGIARLAEGLDYFSTAFPPGSTQTFARACFGDAESKAQALALIDAHLATHPKYLSGVVVYVLLHAGEPARAFALMQDRSTTNDGLVMGELFSPTLAEARRTPEFPEFLRRIGLAAYWDEFGAPEQCRKNAKGDYNCD